VSAGVALDAEAKSQRSSDNCWGYRLESLGAARFPPSVGEFPVAGRWRNATCARMCTPSPIIALVPSGKGVPHRTRADTFARLFEAVHEGVFVGTLTRDPLAEGTTEAVNPFLKAMLGYPPGTADERVAPFAAEGRRR